MLPGSLVEQAAPCVPDPGSQTVTAARAEQTLENSKASTSIFVPSYKEPTVDALAPEAEEGRGRLR
jgi:hypothetical protein